MSLLKRIDDLINKASAGEAVEHTLSTPPKEDEEKKEKNPANSGTRAKKNLGPLSRPEPGKVQVDIDEGENQGYINTKEGGGNAPLARPETKKHEGGEKSIEDADLTKGGDDEEDDKNPQHEAGESEEEEKKERKTGKEDEKKASTPSAAIYLDIDEFKAEIAKSVVEEVIALIEDKYADAFAKASQSEIIGTGLAASIEATLERVEDIEKSHNEYTDKVALVEKVLTNITKALSVRKSVLKKSDMIKNESMEGTSTMSKSEICDALLDMSMKGQGVDPHTVVKFETSGDINVIPENIRVSLGL